MQRTRSLIHHLIIRLVLLSALPLIVIGFITNFILFKELEHDVKENHRSLAFIVANQLTSFIDVQVAELTVLLDHLSIGAIEHDRIAVQLNAARKRHPAFSMIQVLDRRGTVVAVSPSNPDFIGMNQSRLECYRIAKATRRPHLSSTTISLETGEPSTTLTVQNDRWSIISYLDLSALRSFTDRLHLGKSGYAAIIDQKGTIIAHRDHELVRQQVNIRSAAFYADLAARGEGTFLHSSFGRKDYTSGIRLARYEWSVLISESVEDAFEHSRRVRTFIFIGLFITIAVAAAVSLTTLRGVTRPLQALREQAQQAASGIYAQGPGPITGFTELQELSVNFSSMLQAISDREQKLRGSEERYRRLFEDSRDGLVVTDPDGIILDVNRSFVGMLGYDAKEEMLGRHAREFYVQPAARHRLIDEIGRVGFASNFEVTLRRKDGTEMLASLNSTALTGPAGSFRGLQTNIRDITAHRRLEAQLLHAQKMEAVGLLAGGVAHDFNNILTAIIGYANLLRRKAPTDGPLHGYADAILSAAERATELTQSLLTFSRKQIINPRPVDLNMIVQNMERLLRRVVPESITFRADLAPGPLTVLADRGQMEQVLMNLVTNARDAVPASGAVTVGTGIRDIEGPSADQPLLQPGRYAVLTVSDTGSGMDARTRANIFEPFFTTKEVGHGTGLGLSIVYGIITQHHGSIDVETVPGKGSTFRLFLPLVSDALAASSAPSPVQSPGGIERVMVVEDEEPVRKMLQIMLEDAGYSVTMAGDGDEAITLFQREPDRYDIVLLDVVLPRRNGKEVFEAIRAIRPDIKVLFMSGYTDDIIHRNGILDESIDYLQKPAAPEALLKKIRDILDS